MLEDRVRSALVPFRAFFDGLKGRSVSLGGTQIKTITETVYKILRSSGIAKVFSVTAPDVNWPLKSADPNGAKLVEAVGGILPIPADYKMSYTRFILLQRVAIEGGTALPTTLTIDPAKETELLALISQVYTWGTSLRDFQQAV